MMLGGVITMQYCEPINAACYATSPKALAGSLMSNIIGCIAMQVEKTSRGLAKLCHPDKQKGKFRVALEGVGAVPSSVVQQVASSTPLCVTVSLEEKHTFPCCLGSLLASTDSFKRSGDHEGVHDKQHIKF